jgi:group I intron endonuclease
MGNKKIDSGIYKITNIINGKMYIGSTNNLSNRKDNHFSELKRNTHPNKFLQRSVNKYGMENFKFEIIEHCLLEELNIKEGYWCGQLNTYNDKYGYNLIIVNLDGVHIMPENIKEKLRIINTGKKHSEATKEKQRVAKVGKSFDILHKEKITPYLIHGFHNEGHKIKFQKARQRSVLQYDLNDVFIQEFESIKKADDFLSTGKRNNISNCCLGKQKSCCGFKWRYKNGNK